MRHDHDPFCMTTLATTEKTKQSRLSAKSAKRIMGPSKVYSVSWLRQTPYLVPSSCRHTCFAASRVAVQGAATHIAIYLNASETGSSSYRRKSSLAGCAAPPPAGRTGFGASLHLGRADADMTSSSCQLNHGHSCLACLFELAVLTLIQIAQRSPCLGGPHPTGAVLDYPAGSVSQWLLSYSPGLAS